MLDLIVGPMDALTAALAPLRPYAEVITPFHFPEVEAHLAMLAEPDGPLPVSVDVLKFLLTLFVSWPLAAMFAAIPSTLPAVKHGFSLTCGVLLAQFMFGFEWVHALTTATVVYVLLALGQRQAGLARARPLVVFAFMLVYLFAVHMYRVYHSYMVWKLDITSPLMLLTMKVGGGVFTRPFKFLTAPILRVTSCARFPPHTCRCCAVTASWDHNNYVWDDSWCILRRAPSRCCRASGCCGGGQRYKLGPMNASRVCLAPTTVPSFSVTPTTAHQSQLQLLRRCHQSQKARSERQAVRGQAVRGPSGNACCTVCGCA